MLAERPFRNCELSFQLYHGPNWNNRKKLAVVAEARASIVVPCRSARNSAVLTTKAGSLRLPLKGTGVKNGQSVSMSSRSNGTTRAESRKFSAFLKVTLPANEMKNPNFI